MPRSAVTSSRSALWAARALEASPFVAASGLVLGFVIGLAAATLPPAAVGIDGLVRVFDGLNMSLVVMRITLLAALASVAAGSVGLVLDQAKTGPARGRARATLAGAVLSCLLLLADGLISSAPLLRSELWPRSPSVALWEGPASWIIRCVGAATLAGVVLVLRARGGLLRWGLPLIAAILASPFLHLLAIDLLDAVVFFLLVCTIGTAWRQHLETQTAQAVTAPIEALPR